MLCNHWITQKWNLQQAVVEAHRGREHLACSEYMFKWEVYRTFNDRVAELCNLIIIIILCSSHLLIS